MRKNIIKYLLFIYTRFIVDNDMDLYKKKYLFFFKILLFVKSVYIWILSFLFFPIFIIYSLMNDKFKIDF